MSLAQQVIRIAYEDGEYHRPADWVLAKLGGRKLWSSNNEQKSYSWSPTDEWEFPDGSKVIVGYSTADDPIHMEGEWK